MDVPTKGAYMGTAVSVELVARDKYRDVITIQHINTNAVSFGIGEPAVAGEGIHLTFPGDTLVLRGAQARSAIHVIGGGGRGAYQTGDLTFIPG